MKLKMWAIGLATAAGCSAASADLYVAGAFGNVQQEGDCPAGYSCDMSETGFKVLLGYKFTPNWSAEVSYFDLGKAQRSSGSRHDELESRAVGVGAAYQYEFLPKWSAIGRLGLASVKDRYRLHSGSTATSSDTESTQFYYGLGVAYEFTPEWKIQAAWDATRVDDGDERADLLSIGLSYSY